MEVGLQYTDESFRAVEKTHAVTAAARCWLLKIYCGERVGWSLATIAAAQSFSCRERLGMDMHRRNLPVDWSSIGSDLLVKVAELLTMSEA